MANSGDGLWKRAVHVPTCLLRGTNARIRKILHRLRTKMSKTKRTVSELDESTARPQSRHQSEIEEIREDENELLEKAIMDNPKINRLIDEQKYMAEEIEYLKEDNESTQKELQRATQTVIELRESNEKLMDDLYHLERKCLKQEVQLNDLRVAATTSAVAFARNVATVKGIKATANTVAVAVSNVDKTQPLRSVLKNRAIDQSRKKPEYDSNLRLQVNNNHV